ncbi:hypothetical protein [Bartonella sp. DGB2]|uniref:hypothetical protein n=1 Tax=Bartonella sp. DGB2 TaxID=3388426 RepID=UPI00398FF099
MLARMFQQTFNKTSTNAQQNSTHVDHIEEDKEEDIDIKNICSNEQIQKKSPDDGQPINSAMALETTDSISKSPAKPPEPTQAQLQKSALEEEFDGIFWGEYGHNVNKKKAREAFIKARKKYALKVIMDGVRRYKNSREYHEFRMHAATFLNNARWSDDFTPLGTNSTAMCPYPTPKPSGNRHVAGASILANIETSKRVMPRLQEIHERLLADANH